MSGTVWEVGEILTSEQFPSGIAEIIDGSGYVVAFVPQHIGSARNAERQKMAQSICDRHNTQDDPDVISQTQAQLQAVQKERDEYKFMYEGLCK